jgi:16S rRNA (uracil1498-N3)-methyltransferase
MVSFATAVSGLRDEGYDLALVLFELESCLTLKQALRDAQNCSLSGNREAAAVSLRKIAVFIGPEGGFEQREIDSLTASGTVSVTIGETILRTETAGPAAIAMILYELEL